MATWAQTFMRSVSHSACGAAAPIFIALGSMVSSFFLFQYVKIWRVREAVPPDWGNGGESPRNTPDPEFFRGDRAHAGIGVETVFANDQTVQKPSPTGESTRIVGLRV